MSNERLALSIAMRALRELSRRDGVGASLVCQPEGIADSALRRIQSILKGLEGSDMRPEETLEVISKVEEKHPRMPVAAIKLVDDCRSRAEDGRSITDGPLDRSTSGCRRRRLTRASSTR